MISRKMPSRHSARKSPSALPASSGRDILLFAAVVETLEKRTLLNGLSFAAPVSNSLTATPETVISAELTGDGKTDLITANSNGTISVFLGNGDGTFQSPTTFSSGFTGQTPVIAVGNINGDDNTDLVATTEKGRQVHVFLGNGDGTFASPTTIALPHQALNVAIADVNNDGFGDLLVENYNGTISEFLGNNATGGFTGVTASTIQINGTAGTNTILATDYTGDGNVDLAIGNTQYNTVTLLTGNGNGTFAVASTYSVPSPVAIVESTLTSDRLDDFVIDSANGTFTVLKNDGANDFVQLNAQSLPGYSSSIAAGDFNGDGITDLAVVSKSGQSTQPYILLGNGDGTFQSPIAAATVSGNTSYTSPSFVSADFLGDGRPDLAVIDNGYSSTAKTTVTNVNFIQNTTTGGLFFQPATTVTLANSPRGLSTQAIATGDFRNDGRSDLVVLNSGYNTAQVLLSNGDGTFAPPVTYHVACGPTSVIVTDINNDGFPDIVIGSFQSHDVSVLLGNGDGTFKPAVFTNVPAGISYSPNALTAADFNGDGDMDIAVACGSSGCVTILNGNDTASFVPHVALHLGGSNSGDFFALDHGNLNGDGKPDLVVAETSGHALVALNNGDGTFGPYSSYSVGTNPVAVAVAPLTGNSTRSIVVANSTDGTVSVLLGNGNGTFAAPTTIPVGVVAADLTLADVSGDGNADIIVSDPGFIADSSPRNLVSRDPVRILVNNGNGTFGDVHSFNVGDYASTVAIGDFNADGRPDVAAFSSSTNTVSVLLNTTNTDPGFTSGTTDTFTTGTTGTFVLSTFGFPTPSISISSGALPAGLTLVDNGDGTATLSGTPAANAGENDVVILSASNSVSSATQPFTLIVDQPPAITSAAATVFGSGTTTLSFTVTTTGFPAPALSETGTLPTGVTFVDNGNGTATLSGAPAVSSVGTYPITILATNGITPSATQTFTLTVTHPTIMMMSGGMVLAMGTGANNTFLITGANNMINVGVDGQSMAFSKTTVTVVSIDGGGGNVSILAQPSATVSLIISGGPGQDTIMAMNPMPDTITAGGGNSMVSVATTSPDSLRGGRGNDTIMGGGPGTSLMGNIGNPHTFSHDALVTGSKHESVSGGSGSDTVTGTGHDSIQGGTGTNFFLDSGMKKDSLVGGSGLNFAQFNGTDSMTNITEVIDPPAPVTSAPTAAAQPATASGATATVSNGILEVTAGNAGDTITVELNAAKTKIKALDDGSSIGSFKVATVTAVSVLGGTGNDSISVASDITFKATLSGGAGNDTLVGGGGSNVLIGGGGNDSLTGGAGSNDLIPDTQSFTSGPEGNATLNGGTGSTIADFVHRTDTLHLSNDGLPDSGGSGENIQIDTNIQGILGGTANDTITGTHAGEFLSGGAGANLVTGGGATDLLIGGSGHDSVAVAAEPVVLYLRNNQPDQYSGVHNAAEDILQLDSQDSLVSSFT